MDSVEPSENPNKVPLKRFQLALHKFTDVAIPLHLELLKKHRDNISKFTRLSEWDRVHREQVNASRTVQQLKADIWEVEKVRQQLREEDLAAFDQRVDPVKEQALAAVHAFIGCIKATFRTCVKKVVPVPIAEDHQEVTDPTQLLFRSRVTSNLDEEETKPASADSSIIDEDAHIQEQVNALPQQQTSVSATSWKHLYHELLGLNNMIHTFHGEVKHQQTAVDSIQENLDTVQTNVHEGATHLGKATKLKAAMLPLTGALIGCVAAGPIGLIAGFKLGGLVAVGGGIVGFQGGRYLKQRREQIADVELQDLSKAKLTASLSLPNVPNSVEYEDRRPLSPNGLS